MKVFRQSLRVLGTHRAPLLITFLADPLFHGYLSSGAQKFVHGETACGGAEQISPIPSFMATFINGLICARPSEQLLPAPYVVGPVNARSKNNSPIRCFMATFPHDTG
jgi:hypothetical protein